MRWETEWSFDGKFDQEYSYQKLSKTNLITGFQVTVDNVGDAFSGHSVLVTHRGIQLLVIIT